MTKTKKDYIINQDINYTNPLTIHQAKKNIFEEVKKHLRENLNEIKRFNFKLNKETNIAGDFLTDYLSNLICGSYMPFSYDTMIEWTKQDPMIIECVNYCSDNHEVFGESVISRIRENILICLKNHVYLNLNGFLGELRREVA